MEKKRLVDFVAKIMEKSGFEVHRNYRASNHIVDIYGVLHTVLGDVGVVVACKNYEERWKVGLDVLKEMEMAAKTLQASKAVVITTSEFSDNAVRYADRRNVKLIDKYELMNIAKSFSKKNVETYNIENNEFPDDFEDDEGGEAYVLPSESTGSSFFSRGRKGSLSGRKRSMPGEGTSSKLQVWTKTLLSNTIALIIIVLAVSALISYIINPSRALLGILRIIVAAVLSYGIVMAVERDLMVTLVRGSTVFFVTLIIYIALILLA